MVWWHIKSIVSTRTNIRITGLIFKKKKKYFKISSLQQACLVGLRPVQICRVHFVAMWCEFSIRSNILRSSTLALTLRFFNEVVVDLNAAVTLVLLSSHLRKASSDPSLPQHWLRSPSPLASSHSLSSTLKLVLGRDQPLDSRLPSIFRLLRTLPFHFRPICRPPDRWHAQWPQL